DFVTDNLELSRASSQALRDFAPGATFYARGYAIEIDALDLGRGDEGIRTWVCCPSCGYVVDDARAGRTDDAVEIAAPSECPRCGSSGIDDTGQRLEVIELKRVSSVIRREEATIDDRSDE